MEAMSDQLPTQPDQLVIQKQRMEVASDFLSICDRLSTGYEMVTFAQYEAERTSERTRAALAQKKVQGFSLGKPENLTLQAIQRGEAIRVTNALTNKANVQATELATLYRN